MTTQQKKPDSIIRRSLGIQVALLIIGITVVTLGASSGISVHFSNKTMQTSLETNAREVSGLMRMLVDKSMLIGDDAATSAEFAFLAKNFPDVSISIASFKGNITYSTTLSDVRKDLDQLFQGSMPASDRKRFQRSYAEALEGGNPTGTLLSDQGRKKFLLVSPIFNEKSCYHCHGSSQPVLGAMAVLRDVDHESSGAFHSNLRNALVACLGGLLLTLGIYLFIKHRVISRLISLARTSDSIVAGDFNARFTVTGQDELGYLAGNLTDMLNSLKQLGTAQSVMRGMSIPSAMCDAQGNITFINKPLLDLLHISQNSETLLGTSVNQLLFGRADASDSPFSQVLAANTVCLNRELSIQDRLGNILRVRFDANPVLDLEGNLIGAFSSLTDLTSIRSQEQAVIEKNETIHKAAEEANVLTEEMGRAITALASQIEMTRRQSSRQQDLTDRTVQELETINQAMTLVAENSSQAAGHAGDTKESAVQGARQAGHVAASMQTMVNSIVSLRGQMEELGQKTEGIGRVMQVIQDIADQTNLLALNAAIEAARAGDAGRGFAVVADEVRKLAEKTMQATVEVGNTIHEIRLSATTSIQAVEATSASVNEGSKEVQRTGEVLQRILALSESVAEEVHTIAKAVEEQSSSTESARGSIRSIKDISEEAANATIETETAVRSLIDIAGSLNSIVAGMTAGKEK